LEVEPNVQLTKMVVIICISLMEKLFTALLFEG